MIVIDPVILVPHFSFREVGFDTTATAQRVLATNSQRVAIIFNITSGNAVNVSTRSNVTSADGIRINISAEPMVLRFSDFGGMIGAEWFAVGTLGAERLWVTEVSFYPTRG